MAWEYQLRTVISYREVFGDKALLSACSREGPEGKVPKKGVRIDESSLWIYYRVICGFCVSRNFLANIDVISISRHTVKLSYCYNLLQLF